MPTTPNKETVAWPLLLHALLNIQLIGNYYDEISRVTYFILKLLYMLCAMHFLSKPLFGFDRIYIAIIYIDTTLIEYIHSYNRPCN